MLLMRRDEYDRRHGLIPFLQGIYQFNARQFRHVDVEQEDIICLLFQLLDRLESVNRRIANFNIVPCGQNVRQGAPSERLIIHDQYPHDASFSVILVYLESIRLPKPVAETRMTGGRVWTSPHAPQP